MEALILADAPTHEIVKISSTPRDETESGDTKETVEDLRINLNPYFPWAVVRVTIWITHGGGCLAENEHQHSSPRYDI
jgi:hypothetical protein